MPRADAAITHSYLKKKKKNSKGEGMKKNSVARLQLAVAAHWPVIDCSEQDAAGDRLMRGDGFCD